MKRIISMAVVLVITMAATAQKGELAMNEREYLRKRPCFQKRKRSYSRRQKAESGVYIRRVWRNPDYQTSV